MEMVKTLEEVTHIVFKWEMLNTVTYNISKIEAMLFSKLYQQWLNKQLKKYNNIVHTSAYGISVVLDSSM